MKGEQTFERFRRIRSSSDYARIRQKGQSYHTAHFVVIVNPGQRFSRLGITVSRKVGNAVCRNRLKRWIRDLFRNHYTQFGTIVDVSIIARSRAACLSHAQLIQELLIAFARLETDDHV